jgi:hypothetical protein
VTERFAAAGIAADNISFTRETWVFDSPGPPSRFLDDFRNFFGPTMNAFAAAQANGRAADLQQELGELFDRQNKSANPDVTMIPATYLLVNVAVR